MLLRLLPNAGLLLLLITGIIVCSCNSKPDALFKRLSADKTGIEFNNVVVENDSLNPIDMEFLYNGGGVAVGDFNKDGLPDLYFTASTVANKLYQNEGGLHFKDITAIADVEGQGRWANAASVVDINNDGWQDIYVSATLKTDPWQRRNLLYINQGPNADKIPVFKEMAAEYRLADTGLSVHAAFFDYDKDGDLDMYLLTTKPAKRQSAQFTGKKVVDSSDIDKLFRNDWDEQLKHPVFTDVSRQAGIVEIGYGLGVSITDINRDGWPDIYVTNDFFTSDCLYINNHDGTFTNRVKEYFKHTSQNAMGNDVGDLNNDGLQDIIAVDMNPEDNYRKKKNMSGNNYFIYQSMLYEGLMLQYVRNTVQLNMGPRVNGLDSTGAPVFGDISFATGMAETDWSWTPSIADFDNDGNKDVIITNGYPRDVTDHDFAAFRAKVSNVASKEQLIEQIPQIKVPNYAFRNKGNLGFENVTNSWGLDEPSFSDGAVYVDLDNDGDLDYVINNINEQAWVYENTLNHKDKIAGNYLTVSFKGEQSNLNGIGAWVEVYTGGNMQLYENYPYRGYLSTVDCRAYFGLDTFKIIDSVIIRWPNQTRQVLQHVAANQVLEADIKNAVQKDEWGYPTVATEAIFTDISTKAGIHYLHQETDAIDFNRERLLPHKLSQYGPGMAAGDVDGNRLDDIFIGGSGDFAATLLLQQPGEKFISRQLPQPPAKEGRRPESLGILLFDADNDGDLDVYCANGSNEYRAAETVYQDHLFLNNGKGVFVLDSAALPANLTSKSCVKAADFDNDGDLDIFVGGRVLPGKYPQAVSSFIYRNDSKNGVVKFTDVTADVAKGLTNIGMVCDALFTDFDNDGHLDLIVAGEWMPITFLRNTKGKFENVTEQSGIGNEQGWWNSITGGDFDNDGDIDYIAGNLGVNSFYRASHQYPVRVYGKDFDKNGSFDAIPVVYLKDQAGQFKQFTAQNRDDIIEQLPSLRKKFLTYKSFGEADFQQVFSADTLKDALVLEANNFNSCYIENKGNGTFGLKALPLMAQLSPVNGMVVEDFNDDGNLDVALVANDYGTEVTNGRYDALNGLVLLGDGAGNFTPQTILASGFFVPGDAKALIKLRGADSSYLLAASQNRDALKVFRKKQAGRQIPFSQQDSYMLLTLPGSKVRKQEHYYGSSFLSQSAGFVTVSKNIQQVEIVGGNGAKRVLK
ncbi:VCBS repeat-containing protein [Foetidibacter luteolus]|uniref:VCBS repeat-containing protein n=1 Tax=Foetidibacter luteolus TaxID=2608880 RepID=UPI00129A28A3|nr:VCBS repeat-containing protein [Foetidibacter luteolus]